MSSVGSALAIDHGTKRTGFAVADALRISTNALPCFQGDGQGEELLAHIAGLLDERTVTTILVGAPLNMDGSAGPRAEEVKRFADRVAARFPGIRVVLYDERLTTKAAEDLLRESGVRGLQARALRDSASALVLLRDWIASGEPR